MSAAESGKSLRLCMWVLAGGMDVVFVLKNGRFSVVLVLVLGVNWFVYVLCLLGVCLGWVLRMWASVTPHEYVVHVVLLCFVASFSVMC